MENIEESSGKSQENKPMCLKKDKTDRAIGVSRRTREYIVKWNQMTAQRFQTQRRGQTSQAFLQGKYEGKDIFKKWY